MKTYTTDTTGSSEVEFERGDESPVVILNENENAVFILSDKPTPEELAMIRKKLGRGMVLATDGLKHLAIGVKNAATAIEKFAAIKQHVHDVNAKTADRFFDSPKQFGRLVRYGTIKVPPAAKTKTRYAECFCGSGKKYKFCHGASDQQHGANP
jgi:hypothetical protein